jgi:hypothetical protein
MRLPIVSLLAMAALAAAVPLVAAVAAPRTPLVQGAVREWNQPWASAAASSCVDVVPLATAPREAWRIASEQVLAGPIVAQGRVLAAVRQGGGSRLIAVDAATGKEQASVELDAAIEPMALLSADGLVCVQEERALHVFRIAAPKFEPQKSVAGPFASVASLAGGTLVAAKPGGGVLLLDLAAGKSTTLAAKGLGRPGLAGGSLATLSGDAKGGSLELLRHAVTGSGAGAKVANPEVAGRAAGLGATVAAQAVLVAAAGKGGAEWCAWFGGGQPGGLLRKDGIKALAWRDPPAANGSKLYGFDARDQLIEYDVSTDTLRPLVDRSDFPTGAKSGAPSFARDVLFLGNWALEPARKKVLWCLPDLDPDGALVPAGEELLVARTRGGALVGLARAVNVTAAGAERPRIPRATPTAVPGKEPGLIRSDGIFVAGRVTELPAGGFRLEGAAGAQEYAADWVAAIDDGKTVRRLGEEMPLYRSFRDVLAPRHAEALVPVIEKLRDAKLFEAGRRLLDEARRSGLSAERGDALAAALAGKDGAKGGAALAAKKACAETEADVRETSVKAFRAGARWCAAQKAFVAASVLVARAIELDPENADREIVEDWIAADFPPQADLAATIDDWLRWSDALLASGGRYAVIEDSLARRLSVTKFKEDAIVLETRNIRLISRELDPKVVGPLLVRGEATVRALQKLLGPSPNGQSPKTLLEVRLYKTRAEYLSDSITPPVWSGGCYSPNDSISRFYSEMGDRKSDPVQHSLEEVFAHELTHHYTDVRWLREKRGSDSGSYWMVEGFAEFVASQALEIGRVGDSFDDVTVEPIDKTAAVARVNPDLLLDMQFFLGLDSARFHSELADGIMGSFKLKHTLTEVPMTQRGLFYAQATAFTFFVIHRTGEKGLATYVEWLKRVYSGNKLVEPWKEIGFESTFDLRKAFRDFLAAV